MTSNAALQALDFETRTEPRDRVVQIVEYSPYPRRKTSAPGQFGFSHDRSATGLGLDLAEPLRTGDVLRVTLRDIDGTAAMDGLARVVWCRLGDVARYRAGLVLLRDASNRPLLRRGRAPARLLARRRITEPDLLD